MHAAVLALLLFAGVIDPRLVEPLRLLDELRDADGKPVGQVYARATDALGLSLIVSSLPERMGGAYQPARHVVTLAPSLVEEEPRIVAAGLAHEIRHALDYELVAGGLLPRDCVELEVSAFIAEAEVTRAFWPDELPDATEWERGRAQAVRTYEVGGADAIRAVVRADPGYQQQCAALGA